MKYLKALIVLVSVCYMLAYARAPEPVHMTLQYILGSLIVLYAFAMEMMISLFKEANAMLRNDVKELLDQKVKVKVWCSTCGKDVNSVECDTCSEWWKKQKENIA